MPRNNQYQRDCVQSLVKYHSYYFYNDFVISIGLLLLQRELVYLKSVRCKVLAFSATIETFNHKRVNYTCHWLICKSVHVGILKEIGKVSELCYITQHSHAPQASDMLWICMYTSKWSGNGCKLRCNVACKGQWPKSKYYDKDFKWKTKLYLTRQQK